MKSRTLQRKVTWRAHTLSILTLLSLGFYSCATEENDVITDLKERTGTLEISKDLQVKLEVIKQNPNGRLAALEEVNTELWPVSIFRADGILVLEYDNFRDVPASIELVEGEYYVEVNSDDLDTAAFNSPYFEGRSSNFNIIDGGVTNVTVIAEPRNFRVAVNYTAGILDDFESIFTDVRTSKGELRYQETTIDFGYFEVDTLVEIEAFLTFNTADGSSNLRTITGEISDPQPGDSYTVTIDGSSGSGNFNINIIVSESFNEDSVTFGDPTNPLENFVPGEPYTDPRDGEVYKTVAIRDVANNIVQLWLAENLRFDGTGNSRGPVDQNSGLHYNRPGAVQATPPGWRLPNENDWNVLINEVGPDNYIAKLRAGGDTGLNLDGNGYFNLGGSLIDRSSGYYWVGGSNSQMQSFNSTSQELELRTFPSSNFLSVRYILNR